ncbi:MAG: hypothetical protein HOP12_00125, partial [Candidatus Eisenbacteria bacterium]|nr:hypothetical protein [Candidatus Eisenbacteria bacterium]
MRRERGRRGRLNGLLAAATLAALLAGCAAPAPHGASDLVTDHARVAFDRHVESRRRAAAVEGDALIWTEWRGQRLPGVSVRLYLAGPDACRLRVRGALGLALEAAVWGDSLMAWLPSERAALAFDVEADSIAFRDPGARVWEALASAWKPPTLAWERAVTRDSGRVLEWRDRADSLTLAVDRAGRPTWLRVRPAGGAPGLTVHYTSWLEVAGTPWPERVEASL